MLSCTQFLKTVYALGVHPYAVTITTPSRPVGDPCAYALLWLCALDLLRALCALGGG